MEAVIVRTIYFATFGVMAAVSIVGALVIASLHGSGWVSAVLVVMAVAAGLLAVAVHGDLARMERAGEREGS